MPLLGTGGGAVGTMKQFGYHYQRSILLIVGIVFALVVFCDDHDIVFYMNGNIESLAVDSIDSITFPYEESFMLVALHNRESKLFTHVDSVKFLENSGDTILLSFQDDKIRIVNPRADVVDVTTKGTDVEIVSNASERLVILADGHCNDGRIIIDNNEDCTLVLSDLQLNSKKGSVIYLKQKQKVAIELPTGTHSTLSDASIYSVDSTDTSNGCLYNKGSIAIKGEGTLTVTGNYRHGIASGKNVSVEGGCIIVNDVIKNGINCDKFTMKDGNVSLHLSQDASKGIKAKERIEIFGGRIDGEATGDVTIKDGDVSYCTLMKSDASMKIAGGEIKLTNEGKGGRCISVDGNLVITSGTMSLECNGDGDSYINEEGEVDYYTPKCITADDSVLINNGDICCVSTGLGGKGIVSGTYLSIGSEQNEGGEDVPIVKVKTEGECIVDDVDEDQRFGCPKGIKVDDYMVFFKGRINVTTKGQGGEGLECKGTIRTYDVTIICETFDDGINVGQHLSVKRSSIYCHSINNDGIDSNGKITINDGVVVSISEHEQDESFDSATGRLYIYGGVVFGVGNDWVKVRESEQPVYTTTIMESIDAPIHLLRNKYLAIQDDGRTVLSFYMPCDIQNAFLTFSSPIFLNEHTYQLMEALDVVNEDSEALDGRLKMNGELIDCNILKEIKPTMFNN